MSKSNRKKDSLNAFNVSRIPPAGVPVRIHTDTPDLKSVLEEMHGYDVSQISGQLLVAADGHQDVTITGDLSVELSTLCARCGRDISWQHTGAVDLRFVPDPGGKPVKNERQLERIQTEIEVEYDSMDVGFYQNGRISILDAIGEHLFMALPSVLRCESDGVEADSETCVLPEISPPQIDL